MGKDKIKEKKPQGCFVWNAGVFIIVLLAAALGFGILPLLMARVFGG